MDDKSWITQLPLASASSTDQCATAVGPTMPPPSVSDPLASASSIHQAPSDLIPPLCLFHLSLPRPVPRSAPLKLHPPLRQLVSLLLLLPVPPVSTPLEPTPVVSQLVFLFHLLLQVPVVSP